MVSNTKKKYIHISYLSGWWFWNMNFMTFHVLGMIYNPNWTFIFFRGVGIPPTRIVIPKRIEKIEKVISVRCWTLYLLWLLQTSRFKPSKNWHMIKTCGFNYQNETIWVQENRWMVSDIGSLCPWFDRWFDDYASMNHIVDIHHVYDSTRRTRRNLDLKSQLPAALYYATIVGDMPGHFHMTMVLPHISWIDQALRSKNVKIFGSGPWLDPWQRDYCLV